MTREDFYRVYRQYRMYDHCDHIKAVCLLLKVVVNEYPDMLLDDFYNMKMEFMERYFNETNKEYELKMKG